MPSPSAQWRQTDDNTTFDSVAHTNQLQAGSLFVDLSIQYANTEEI